MSRDTRLYTNQTNNKGPLQSARSHVQCLVTIYHGKQRALYVYVWLGDRQHRGVRPACCVDSYITLLDV